MNNKLHGFFLLACLSVTSGCALLPGLQSYDIPESGVYETEQGTKVLVTPLSPTSIAQLNTPEINQKQRLSELFSYYPELYLLNSGDILKLSFWSYPELSTAGTGIDSGYRIDQYGKLNLPLVGAYEAKGKTISQVRSELKRNYARFLKDPDINVDVIAFQGLGYSVQGQVVKAGQFYFNENPVSFYKALGEAGGLTPNGTLTSIDVYRGGNVYNINSLLLEDQGLSLHKLFLKPNDTVFINSKDEQKVYVIGEAGRNQALTIRDRGMSLADALGESLGINSNTASSGRIYVLRNTTDGHMNLYHLDLLQLGNFALANNFAMQKNDIVYIDATGLARWQRVINQLLPFSAGLNNIQRSGL